MIRHEERCDHCEAVLSGYDSSFDYTWAGLRLRHYDPNVDRGSKEWKPVRRETKLIGNHHFQEVNDPQEFQIGYQHRSGTASTSSGAKGFVLPGVVCSKQCFEEWMMKQIARVMDELPEALAVPPREEDKPRAVMLEDEA